jgi:hypothetical protein
MTPLYWALLIIGAPLAFAVCLFLFGRHKEREAKSISLLESTPLPQTVDAYRRVGFLLTQALLSAFFAFLFFALAASEIPSLSIVLVITIPFGTFALFVFARSVTQLFRDTRLTPWGKPVISLSSESICVKGRWSVPWNRVDEIHYVRAGGKFPKPFMLLNVQDCRHFGKNSWFDSLFLWFPASQFGIRSPFLSLELGSTSLAVWQYEILAKRYWCASRNVVYVPTPLGRLIDGSAIAGGNDGPVLAGESPPVG